MILITGASGNVGSEVLKQAAAAKLPLRAAYQTAEKAKAAPAGVETALLDFNQADTVRAALRGIEITFLVGPPTANVAELEGRFVDEAKKSGVKRIVKLSAMGARTAIFPSLHRDSEEKIEAAGIPYTFLRPNGFMQNFVNYNAATIQSQNAFYGAQGNGAVSHIDIRDIAAVAVKVMSGKGHEGKAYPLTGMEALTNEQVAQKLSRVLGRTIRYVDLAPGDMKKAMLAAAMPEWSVNAVLDLQRMYSRSGASMVDPTAAQLLGRAPISFEHFVRDYAAAFAPQAASAD